MFGAVAFQEIGRHLVAIFPGKVDIEIGRRTSIGIQKALEVQVELDGIYLGDFQAIGNHAVGSATPADMREVVVPCIAHQVVGDKKIGLELAFRDHIELAQQALHGIGIVVAVPAPEALQSHAAQLPVVLRHTLPEKGLVFVAAQIDVDAALLDQAFGVGDDARILPVIGQQLRFRQHNLAGIGQMLLPELAQHGIACYGLQQAVDVVAGLVAKGHRMQHHEFMLPPGEPRTRDAVYLRWTNAEIFVFPEFMRFNDTCRIYEKSIGQFGCPRGQTMSLRILGRKKAVERFEARIARSQADVQQF